MVDSKSNTQVDKKPPARDHITWDWALLRLGHIYKAGTSVGPSLPPTSKQGIPSLDYSLPPIGSGV